MKVDERLVESAISFIRERFPEEAWAGAAAMYTEDGEILVSTAAELPTVSIEFCHETGAICEAFKRNKRISATVSVTRDECGHFHFLKPCAKCEELLRAIGRGVEVAMPDSRDSTKWISKNLDIRSERRLN